jgi:hypothetical protein
MFLQLVVTLLEQATPVSSSFRSFAHEPEGPNAASDSPRWPRYLTLDPGAILRPHLTLAALCPGAARGIERDHSIAIGWGHPRRQRYPGLAHDPKIIEEHTFAHRSNAHCSSEILATVGAISGAVQYNAKELRCWKLIHIAVKNRCFA